MIITNLLWILSSILLISFLSFGGDKENSLKRRLPPLPKCNKTTILATGDDGKVDRFQCNINKALEFVHLHGGGRVYLSSGLYPISRQLVIYDNTTLEGEIDKNKTLATIRLEDNVEWSDRGVDGVWRKVPPLIINDANSANRQDIVTTASSSSNSNITIKNISINGNRDNQIRKWHLGEGNCNIIDFIKVNNIKISNVKIYNSPDDGIFIKTGTNIEISNCDISDVGHSAIFQVEVDGAVIENNKIDVIVNSGIRFFGGTDFTIRGNYIFSSKGYGNYGIQVSQAYSYGNPMRNVLIEKNIIKQTPYAGIALYASKADDFAEAIIKNNIIYQCGSKAPNMSSFPSTTIEESGGINIQSFRKVTIANNTLFNNHGSAIWLDNRFYSSDVNFDELNSLDKNATIINNIIVGSRSTQKSVYGIEKYSSSHNGTTLTVDNNIFYNNQNGTHSSNITLNSNNFTNENPHFVDAPIYDNIENIYNNPNILNKKLDFRLEPNSRALDNSGKVIIGASIVNR